MRLQVRQIAAIAAVAVVTTAGAVHGQQAFPSVKVQGRLQEQFYYFNNTPYAAIVGPKDNVFTRRARIEARAQINEFVSVFIQPSFEGGRTTTSTTTCRPITIPAGGGTVTPSCTTTSRGGIRLRDAYIDVRVTPIASNSAIYLRAGQEKRPMGRYELTSSNNLPSIERGAGQGLLPAASNDLFTGQGFLSHDVGAHLMLDQKLDAVRHVTLTAGVYNGQGESLNDVNNAKSYAVRGTAGVWDKLDIGGSYFSNDAIVGADSAFRHWAWGVDAAWSKPGEPGLYLVGDYMFGQDRTAAKNKIRGISAVGAYNIRMSNPNSWLYAVEPAFRFDSSDPNTLIGGDRVTTITAGLNLYIASKAIFRAAYERQSFQAGTQTISGLRSQLQVAF
jgi:hypothetical protein